MPQQAHEALADAKLVGVDGNNRICAWYGGYTFNVYQIIDNGLSEVTAFTSGRMGADNMDDREMYRTAVDRMRLDGFTPLDWEE